MFSKGSKNEKSEREIKETIPFIIATKKKYFGISLPKEIKDLYIETDERNQKGHK